MKNATSTEAMYGTVVSCMQSYISLYTLYLFVLFCLFVFCLPVTHICIRLMEACVYLNNVKEYVEAYHQWECVR